MKPDGTPELAPEKIVYIVLLRNAVKSDEVFWSPVAAHSTREAAEAYVKSRVDRGVAQAHFWRVYDLVLDKGAML